ncbi:CGNR zinc finger domain-containing protein [Micromonospora sp. BQ11]|uniref:CGNR zinc finger domain-containing protein n=1 Tax=Micromonospora sp. BQ11 TaxID=3452212 RepID=UPI003F8AB132
MLAADGRVRESWSVDDPDRAGLAAAALALRAHLAAHPGRLGVCADEKCADVYADASPAGHRRFCSLTCQNRTRTAAFRRRRARSG